MGLIPVDQVVAAPEVVIAKSPNLVVQPLETAIVRAIDVHAGEQVHAGQILARLDPTFAVADLSANAAQVNNLQENTAGSVPVSESQFSTAHKCDFWDRTLNY
jgi:hemolysin D